jgi:hypothetical protein
VIVYNPIAVVIFFFFFAVGAVRAQCPFAVRIRPDIFPVYFFSTIIASAVKLAIAIGAISFPKMVPDDKVAAYGAAARHTFSVQFVITSLAIAVQAR